MQEHPKLRRHVAGLPAEDLIVICSIVRGEILHAIERLAMGRRRRDLEAKAAKLFAVVPCESVPEAAGDHYAQVKITRARKGLAMDENDIWIAATALALGATLVSRDRDLQQVDGLTVADWTV